MIKYVLLGILQGITEFLPVSSSGHLVILQHLLKISQEGLALAVVLHLGTAASVVVFFFKDIIAALRNRKILSFIIIVTLLTGIIGLSGRDFFEGLFRSPPAVALALLFTGFLLISTRVFKEPRRDNPDTKDAIILGLAQGSAIIPGISRSGITIITLLFRGLDRKTSFHLSFLASIPAVLGAVLLEARNIGGLVREGGGNLLAGVLFSFLSGLLALRLLKAVVLRARLHYFGYYCLALAILTLIFIR